MTQKVLRVLGPAALVLTLSLIGCPGPGVAPECGEIAVVSGGSQASVWDDGTVSVSVLVEVEGNLEDLTWLPARILPGEGTPRALTDATVAPNGGRTATLRGQFDPDSPADGRDIPLQLTGAYTAGAAICPYELDTTVSPATHEDVDVHPDPLTLTKRTLADADWTLTPPDRGDLKEEEEDPGLPVPIGPPRELMARASAASTFSFLPELTPGVPAFPTPQPQDTSLVVTHLHDPTATWLGEPPDPTLAASTIDDLVLIGANTTVGWSADGGDTMQMVNLFGAPDPQNPARTTFFPQDDGGMCCDFVMAYAPRYDLFLWVSLTWPDATTGTNRMRLAWASGDGMAADFANAWTWIDVLPSTVGIGEDWLDYPDLTVSDGYVYLSADHAIHGTGSVWMGERIFTRWSLSDMADTSLPYVTGGGASVYGEGLFKSHFARGSRDAAYWAALRDTSTMDVYTWSEETGAITSFGVGISSFQNVDYVSKGPDGKDWNIAPKGVLGGAYARSETVAYPSTYFAFSAARWTEAGRPEPYVRIEEVNLDDRALATEVDIWNDAYAFSTPALAPECGLTCDIGMAVSVGGGGAYGEHSIGFLYDWIVYTTGASDSTQGRWGDYYGVVPSVGPDLGGDRGSGFSSLGYDIVGGYPHLNYVQFGREGVLVQP